jgi:hypothetical protein
MSGEMIDSLRRSDIPEFSIEEKLSLMESRLPILSVEIDDNLLNLEDLQFSAWDNCKLWMSFSQQTKIRISTYRI